MLKFELFFLKVAHWYLLGTHETNAAVTTAAAAAKITENNVGIVNGTWRNIRLGLILHFCPYRFYLRVETTSDTATPTYLGVIDYTAVGRHPLSTGNKQKNLLRMGSMADVIAAQIASYYPVYITQGGQGSPGKPGPAPARSLIFSIAGL